MGTKSKEEKRAYHRQYYQDNIERLQGLARIRYWALVYKLKDPPGSVVKKREANKPKFIKGTFTLNFD